MLRVAAMMTLASAMRVCGDAPSATVTAESPPSIARPAVAAAGALRSEVRVEAGGRVVANVQDLAGNPVHAHEVTLSLRRPDEDPVSVAVTYDEPSHAYVGHLPAVEAGNYPVELSVRSTPTSDPVLLVTPAVTVATPVLAPTAAHGGEVQIVGEYTVETVRPVRGEVRLYVSDREGHPVPPEVVTLPSIELRGTTRTVQAVPRREGDFYVVNVEDSLEGAVVIGVPSLEIRGHRYHGLRGHHGLVVVGGVVARPTVAVVAAPAVVVAAPTVVVEAPVLVVEQPGIFIGVEGHGGHRGRGRGHGRGHDDDDDHHDRGRHRGRRRGFLGIW
ncbi:MAG: hypothetical protein Q8Q09_17685 [Deltaproteobacteria bacterium]|nr:hypothetical protein [Deltaproteobacteria bacterium]